MAKRSCALIGPGRGPQVHTGGVPSQIHVKGLQAKESLMVVHQINPTDDAVEFFHQNGIHDLASYGASFVRASYEGTNSSFTCVVLIGGRSDG